MELISNTSGTRNPFSGWTLGSSTPTYSGGLNIPVVGYNPALVNDVRALLGQTQPATNVKITTPSMQSGQTTLDKILGTFLSFTALQKGAGYVPTTTQPVNQYQTTPQDYYANQLALQQAGAGATVGARLEQFVTDNVGIIAIGAIAFVLFKSGRK